MESVKLGRLPEFLYRDVSQLCEEESEIATTSQNKGAAQFKAQFWTTFQYFQERC